MSECYQQEDGQQEGDDSAATTPAHHCNQFKNQIQGGLQKVNGPKYRAFSLVVGDPLCRNTSNIK